jgi:UTP--glucose-1-phosphate uridylyltransferase
VAGLGTRFLPATKATPKEMLPVVDKPAIQYVVEEAVTAGMSDILMVTGRNKRPLEDHFDRNYELEETLARKGDRDKLARVCAPTELATAVHYVRQGDPKGLGHAVLCAAPHVGSEPFASSSATTSSTPATRCSRAWPRYRPGTAAAWWR